MPNFRVLTKVVAEKSLTEKNVHMYYIREKEGKNENLKKEGKMRIIVLPQKKKRENLEYYFITCIFPNVMLKSGFRKSCSVRRKLFEESSTTALTPNSHMTAYISVLKFLQVSVKSITHFKIAIALYMPVLFLSTAIQLIVSIQSA